MKNNDLMSIDVCFTGGDILSFDCIEFYSEESEYSFIDEKDRTLFIIPKMAIKFIKTKQYVE